MARSSAKIIRQDQSPARETRDAQVHELPQGFVPASMRVALHDVVVRALEAGARSLRHEEGESTESARQAAREIIREAESQHPAAFSGDTATARGARAMVMAAADMGQLARSAALLEAAGQDVPKAAPAAYRAFASLPPKKEAVHRMADDLIDMLALGLELRLEE